MKIKKLIIAVLMILSLFLFSACSTAEETFIEPFWNNYEEFTFNAYENDKIIGTMTITIKKLYDETADFSSDKKVENATGSIVNFNLDLNNGDYVKSRVLFKTNFIPIYSERSFKNGDREVFQTQSYDGKHCNYTIDENGNKREGKIKVKNLHTDNEMLYTVIRASRLENPKYSGITIQTPIIQEGKASNISCIKQANSDVINDFNEKATCYVVSVNKSNGKGSPIKIKYATENITVNGLEIKKAPVQIIEGSIVYTLTNAFAA